MIEDFDSAWGMDADLGWGIRAAYRKGAEYGWKAHNLPLLQLQGSWVVSQTADQSGQPPDGLLAHAGVLEPSGPPLPV